MAIAGAPSTASAADNHSFDPVLSLRGDALVDATDQVPDPGPIHPTKQFYDPCGIATDSHGDIYVASGAVNPPGTEGRIDIFDSAGRFLKEVPNAHQPCSLAVDSEGNLYTAQYENKDVTLYEPDSYPPAPTTSYSESVVSKNSCVGGSAAAVAVDPSDDHLYVATGCGGVREFDSAANGSALIEANIGAAGSGSVGGVDVCGRNHDVYVSATVAGSEHPNQPADQRIFVFDGTNGEKKLEIAGPPGEGFGFIFGNTGVAVDQANCDVYVTNFEGDGAVDRFSSTGGFIGRISYSFAASIPWADVAVDNPCRTAAETPCSGGEAYDSPNAGHVYVGSGGIPSKSHLYAFAASPTGPPSIEEQDAGGISDTDAVLRAKLNPEGLETTYRFEYTTQASFEAEGYAGAVRFPSEAIGAGSGTAPISVSVPIAGLQGGVAYHFRAVASNDEGITIGEGKPGDEGKDATFSTFEGLGDGAHCPNSALRAGPSASLPDCRAYELVSPPNTNGRTPTLLAIGGGQARSLQGFYTPASSPSGESLIFGTEGGSLPGTEANGYHDIYEAVRSAGGWHTQAAGLSAAQAEQPSPGGVSADHAYSLWDVNGANGSLARPDLVNGAHYVRGPGGAIEPVGAGTLGTDLSARGKWISAGGGHVIFTSGSGNNPAIQLEPQAPPGGTDAIYDRSIGGTTHVVSIKPNEQPLLAGQNASYLGTAADGTAVAFKVGATMYVRLGDSETREVSTGPSTFAGLSRDGRRLLYVEGGDIFVYDSGKDETQKVGSGGESTVVNFSADGSHVYFVSPKQLDGGQGTAGAENLYVWDGAQPRFIATLEPLDVSGREISGNGGLAGGLGLWASYGFSSTPNGEQGPAADPSRTTPDGSVLVFESRAQLTSIDNAGHVEVYRYGAADGSLLCLSCSRTGSAAVSDAQLQSDPAIEFALSPPTNALIQIVNVTSDGSMVFFQSADRLAFGDNDGKIDVYEWEAQGFGGCARQEGCIRLISSGHSARDDYLYGMSADGHDVFIESSDLLNEGDTGGAPSIYDARVGGGFSAPAAPGSECLGDACQPAAVAPSDATPASANFVGPQNPRHKSKRSCPKAHKPRTRGKARCTGKKSHHKQRQAGTEKGG